MNEVKYRHITIWTEDLYPDIIFGIYSPKLVIDISMAKELVDNRLDFTQGKPVYTMIDFTNVKSVTKEARDYMNNPEGGLKAVLGGAFLSNNVVATLFINLYLKVNNPSIPAKLFTNKAEAIHWLTKIKAEKPQLEAV
jgi:hypothetical protein